MPHSLVIFTVRRLYQLSSHVSTNFTVFTLLFFTVQVLCADYYAFRTLVFPVIYYVDTVQSVVVCRCLSSVICVCHLYLFSSYICTLVHRISTVQ